MHLIKRQLYASHRTNVIFIREQGTDKPYNLFTVFQQQNSFLRLILRGDSNRFESDCQPAPTRYFLRHTTKCTVLLSQR